MESQLGNLITVIWTFVIVFGIFVFMVGSVLLAELLRRERTKTLEDDWISFNDNEKEEDRKE